MLWRSAGELPANSKGLAGPVTGVCNGKLIVAGGSNFPDSMPWLGGKKKYYSNGYVFRKAKNDSLVSFKTFNLNTNNTSGGINITTNLSVSGTHTFTSGLITTAASKYLIYEDNATNTGASDAAHVVARRSTVNRRQQCFCFQACARRVRPIRSRSIQRASMRAATTASPLASPTQMPTPCQSAANASQAPMPSPTTQ